MITNFYLSIYSNAPLCLLMHAKDLHQTTIILIINFLSIHQLLSVHCSALVNDKTYCPKTVTNGSRSGYCLDQVPFSLLLKPLPTSRRSIIDSKCISPLMCILSIYPKIDQCTINHRLMYRSIEKPILDRSEDPYPNRSFY